MAISATIIEYACQLAATGSSAALALALGSTPEAANRTGVYSELSAGVERLSVVVGGIDGASIRRSGSDATLRLQAGARDGIALAPRGGGTGTWLATITTAALTASATYTFPAANIEVQGTHEVQSTNWQARNHGLYTAIASSTVTDPGTPSPGHEFTTLVCNGTATIGGTAYATSGAIVRRVYHSGSWTNYQYPHVDGAWTWTEAQTFNLSATIGTGIGLRNLVINGGNSGANGGASIYLQQGGVTGCAFGNISSILGGTYDSSTSVWTSASTPIKFYAGSTLYGQFDSGGNFGIGVYPSYSLDVFSGATNAAQISGSSTNTNRALASYDGLRVRNRSVTDGNLFSIINSDGNGAPNAQISFVNVSHVGLQGGISFVTRNGGSWAERAFIDPSGNLCLGVTPTDGNGLLQLASGTTKANGIAFGTDTFIWRSAPGVIDVQNNLRVTGDTVLGTDPGGTGVLRVGGTIIATNLTVSGFLSGIGSGVSGIIASNITSGTLSDDRLSTNVPLKNQVNTFTSDQLFASRFGYANGVGNQVVQTTSVTTGVTINTLSGRISLYSGTSIAAGGTATFFVTNSSVFFPSTVVIANVSNGYHISVEPAASGFYVRLYNPTAGTLGTADIQFILLRSPTT